MRIEKIAGILQARIGRQVLVTVGAQALVLLDELRWFVVFKMAAGTTSITENRKRATRHVPSCGVALHAGLVRDTFKQFAVAVFAVCRCLGMAAIHRPGEPPAVVRQ